MVRKIKRIIIWLQRFILGVSGSCTGHSCQGISLFKKSESKLFTPPKNPKIKNIYKEASNKKFYKTDPPQVGTLIQNTI